MGKQTLATQSHKVEWFSIQILVNFVIVKLLENNSVSIMRLKCSFVFITDNLNP